MGFFKSLFGKEEVNEVKLEEFKKVDEGFNELVEKNLQGIELEKRDLPKAIKLYEEVIEKEFDGNHPYDRLAVIYRKKKDYDNEIRVLKKAIYVFENNVNPERLDKEPKLQRFKERLKKVEELILK